MCAYISSFFPPLFLLSATWIGGRLGLKELVTFFFFFLPEFMGVWRSEAHVRVTNKLDYFDCAV